MHSKDHTKPLGCLEGTAFLTLSGSRHPGSLGILTTKLGNSCEVGCYLTSGLVKTECAGCCFRLHQSRIYEVTTGTTEQCWFQNGSNISWRKRKKKKKAASFQDENQHFCVVLHWHCQLRLSKLFTSNWTHITR